LTLKNFIQQNKALKNLNKLIANFYKTELETDIDNIHLGALSEKLEHYKIENIEQLTSLINDNEKEISKNLANFLFSDPSEVFGVDQSVGIHTILGKITTANNVYKK